jgi:spore maturation protein CgeB
MPRKYRLAYFAHTLRSDWNNGNAHFLRGLLRALRLEGHDVTAYEPESEWSIDNLREETGGSESLAQFLEIYSDIDVQTYAPDQTDELWLDRLRGTEIVILHEWNPPGLARMLLGFRDKLGFRLLFHDTHHRASSSPEQIGRFGLRDFDGVLSFGEALSNLYRERFGLERVWTFHEAADTTVFHPYPEMVRRNQVVWIGNWGEGERAEEIRQFLLQPSSEVSAQAATTIYGVRYPEEALTALRAAGVHYGGYLANLEAPRVYAESRVTVHIPRQQYTQAMSGIPTIRVFEALACGIPLVSAPWVDTENLFRRDDFLWAGSSTEMADHLRFLLTQPEAADAQAERGRETVLARHTCAHRALELAAIFEELCG